MSNLIQRFKEDLQLAGYAKRSIDSYVSAVLRLQRFFNKPLEDISEEQLRQYWLCCQSEFGWSAATLSISYSGIQHFFRKTLVREWNIFNDIKWKREQTLPTILSLEEVRTIIYALPTAMRMRLICWKQISPYDMFKKYWATKRLRAP